MIDPNKDLPRSAVNKLNALRMHADAAAESAHTVTRRISELEKREVHISDPAALRANRDDIAALRVEQTAQQERRNVAAAVMTRATDLLRDTTLRPGQFVVAVPTTIKLQQGETLLQAIERTRQSISDGYGELVALRRMPPTKDDRLAALSKEIDRLRARGQVVATFSPNGACKLSLPAHANDHAPSSSIALEIVAWLHPSELYDRLASAIKQDAEGLLSLAERAARKAELEAQLLSLERDEEALVERAAEVGQLVLRRDDASPLAVLGIEIASTAAAESPKPSEPAKKATRKAA